jgi:hypothetical protein
LDTQLETRRTPLSVLLWVSLPFLQLTHLSTSRDILWCHRLQLDDSARLNGPVLHPSGAPAIAWEILICQPAIALLFRTAIDGVASLDKLAELGFEPMPSRLPAIAPTAQIEGLGSSAQRDLLLWLERVELCSLNCSSQKCSRVIRVRS